jgi:hypothetical protein
MIPAVNGLCAYAFGIGLQPLLAGSRIEAAWRYAGGMTFALSGGPVAFLDILLLGAAAEIVPSREPAVPARGGDTAFSAAEGCLIGGIRPAGLDRVLLIELDEGEQWSEREPLVLRIDLTGAFRAVSLFRGEGTRPLETFGTPGSRIPRSADEMPTPKPFSLLDPGDRWPPDILEDEIGMEADVLEPDLARTERWRRAAGAASRLAQEVSGIDPALARSLIARSISGEDTIDSALRSIADELAAGRFDWGVYDLPAGGEGAVCAVYPVRLPFPTRPGAPRAMLEAIALRAGEAVLPAWTERLRAEVAAGRRRTLKRSRRLLANVERDLLEAQEAERFRHYGNLLVTWRHRLRTGLREITVTDYAGDREITIELDPALDPERNIRRYFRRAKKGEKGRAVIQARRGEIRKEIRRLEGDLAAIEKSGDREELAAAAMRGRRAPAAARAREAPARFRRYALGGGFEILIGRTDRENDELTHRTASPGDLWFHAQGCAGSHVVLRGGRGSVPSRIVQAAAEAAAWFSKARNSGTVPVIYTEKRYVRKPRGSRPGTAACLRGKTLFVTPRLPDTGREDEGAVDESG